MKTSFKGIYHDGVTARGWNVAVTVEQDGVSVLKEDGTSFFWSFKEIDGSGVFSKKGRIRLKIRSNPYQSIIISDREFLDIFKRSNRYITAAGPFGPGKTLLAGVAGVAGAASMIAFLYLVAIPFIVNSTAELMPVQWEERLGMKTTQQIFSGLEVCNEPEVDDTVRRVMETLNSSAQPNPYTFKVSVVKSDYVNALAAPGGQIILFGGLVEKTSNAEELAGVLAHEMQHILNRHATKSIIKNLSTGMLLNLLFGNAGNTTGSINLIDRLRYSRTIEEEADREAVDLLVDSGIDPDGIVRFFEELQKKEQGGPFIPFYLSTHPETSERIRYLKEKISSNKGDAAFNPLLTDVPWEEVSKKCSSKESKKTYESLKEKDGWTSLHVAAAAGDVSELNRVLSDVRDIDVKNASGRTPLYEAAKRGRVEAMKMLLNSGARIDIQCGEAGFTPLHVASEYKHRDVVLLLLDRGADVDAMNVYEQTPLWQVAGKTWHSDTEIAEMLISKGATVDSADIHGFTPLHIASQAGNLKIMELLISKGAYIDAVTKNGSTPLSLAAEQGNYDSAFLLLKSDADADKGSDGRNPLRLAVHNKHERIASLLRKYGAN